MDKVELEVPRKKILDTMLGTYIKQKYDDYLIGDQEKAAECKEIWRKTFLERGNNNVRDKIFQHLNIKEYIDEGVIIGDELIFDVLNHVRDAVVFTDKNVWIGFEGKFSYQEVVFIEDIDGRALKNIINIVNEGNVKFLVGIGGGRVMDYLKYVQLKTGTFCIAIPTSLATHVYTSPKIHVLPAIAQLGETMTVDGPIPDISVIDIGFLSGLQKTDARLINAGLGDLMACITAVFDWKMAQEHGVAEVNGVVEQMCRTIIDTLFEVDTSKSLSYWVEDYCFIQVLLCRISGWVGSAPVSGSEHLFALAAEQGLDVIPLHGELVALGTLIMGYIQGDYKKPLNLIDKIGLPRSLSKIGITKEQTVNALYNCKTIAEKKGRFTIVNTLSLDRDYCNKVISDMMKAYLILD